MRYKYCVRHNRRHYCLRTRVASSPINRRMQSSRRVYSHEPGITDNPDKIRRVIRKAATASFGAGSYQAYRAYLRGGPVRAVSKYHWDPKTQGYKRYKGQKYFTPKARFRASTYYGGRRAPSAAPRVQSYPRPVGKYSTYAKTGPTSIPGYRGYYVPQRYFQ